MGQRRWTMDEKLSIVMGGLKGMKSVSKICRERKLSQTQYHKWREQ
ncbi:MAG: transposase [Nitrospirae bacterium]|nr:transposase [Nitrospirota bacterium]